VRVSFTGAPLAAQRRTPLLALVALLLGLFAVMVTPREEEPQINVTMANVLIPFPGASVRDVEQMVATPAEQVLAQIAGIEHVMSVSRPGMAVLTVQFEVGVPRTEALVRLHDTINANADWLPRAWAWAAARQAQGHRRRADRHADAVRDRTTETGRVRPGARRAQHRGRDQARARHARGADHRRPGPRGAGRARPGAAGGRGVTVADLRQALQSANLGLPVGELLGGDALGGSSPGIPARAREVAELVVGVHAAARCSCATWPRCATARRRRGRYVWHGTAARGDGRRGRAPGGDDHGHQEAGRERDRRRRRGDARVDELRNTVIPAGVEVAETRNYGATADDKANKLIQKLLFATGSVVALVFVALGRREAAIVGAAVILTLTVTLFASWAWGFTLNRVSLFALIFSIGILVDDAIVVVENIHRHQALYPGRRWRDHPGAVDEVGGPTILATLTVIAALLPMAFVSGLMGPYMSPIPINASMGMLLSLAIAFVVTPWLARLWMKPHAGPHGADDGSRTGLAARSPGLRALVPPLLDERRGGRNRGCCSAWASRSLIALSVALPAAGWWC
jgi:multidrug efflux pump subunit AcrB